MINLKQALEITDFKDLVRMQKSNKEYFFFDISVFNVGACVTVKCTDTYKEINPNTWNGYDFLIENDHDAQREIKKEINRKRNLKN